MKNFNNLLKTMFLILNSNCLIGSSWWEYSRKKSLDHKKIGIFIRVCIQSLTDILITRECGHTLIYSNKELNLKYTHSVQLVLLNITLQITLVYWIISLKLSLCNILHSSHCTIIIVTHTNGNLLSYDYKSHLIYLKLLHISIRQWKSLQEFLNIQSNDCIIIWVSTMLSRFKNDVFYLLDYLWNCLP